MLRLTQTKGNGKPENAVSFVPESFGSSGLPAAIRVPGPPTIFRMRRRQTLRSFTIDRAGRPEAFAQVRDILTARYDVARGHQDYSAATRRPTLRPRPTRRAALRQVPPRQPRMGLFGEALPHHFSSRRFEALAFGLHPLREFGGQLRQRRLGTRYRIIVRGRLRDRLV